MARSRKEFNRWTPRESSSWAYQVFKRHETELYRMYWAFQPTVKLTYGVLGKSAKWEDKPTDHLQFADLQKAALFKNVRDWSNCYNEFENWVHLNALLSLVSYMETYMASIVSIALESDIGVIYAAPRSIDGVIKKSPLAKWGEVKIVNPVARFPPDFLRVAASSNPSLQRTAFGTR
jgi:hypothetical protein